MRRVRILTKGDQVARQRTHALRAHRVAFVGHRRRTDLIFLNRLFDFFQVREQAQIGGELVRGRTQTGED